MNTLKIWLLAIRPKTLSISVSPVLLGSCLAWQSEHVFNSLIFLLTLISALAIQVGTNLYNDAKDFEKGADTEHRLGPKRAAQQEWLTVSRIKNGAIFSFILAFSCGIYLAYSGGWPIIVLGLLSIICGFAYTGGPKPIAYSPFGELFVLLFFGFAAVSGTFYLQTHSINLPVIIVSSSLGIMAAAILLVNNYRDLEGDEKANKLTLVHYAGRPVTRNLFVGFIAYPYFLSFLLISMFSWKILLTLLSLPFAIYLVKLFLHLEISSKLNQVLARTAQLQLVYSLLFCMGLLL